MQEIKAIVRSDRLNAILDALHRIPGLPGVIVSSARAIGHRVDPAPHELQYDEMLMSKLEIVVGDDLVPRVVMAIEASGRTGRAGDGKIFVSAVSKVRRIRTGEQDESAV